MKTIPLLVGVALVTICLGCGDDGGTPEFVPEAYGQWLKFEPEGTVCANGSQYKYFINFSEASENLVIFLEGGSACWNYEDCANARPFNTECIKEPAGTECIRDDYFAVYLHLDELEPISALTEPLGVVNGDVPVDLAYPMLSSNADINPMGTWNKVFIPYCTGDTYLGSVVRTYVDPDGVGPDVEFHHMGHQNMLRVIEDLNSKFRSVPKMMVSGCSAGGVGSLNNYAFIRNGMEGVENGYLIADSGPVMPSTLVSGEPSHSNGLYDRVAPVWEIDTMIASLPFGDRVLADRGEVNALLAEAFPSDRLSISIFERDYNFTVSSYEDVFQISVDTGSGRTEIYRLTSEDLEALRAQFDAFDNLAYYMPYYRNTNDSHCLTVTGLDDVGASPLEFLGLFQDDPSAATWSGTEIETNEGTVTFKDHIEHVLDDSATLQSRYEGTCEGKFQVCALDCPTYDPVMCDEVVQ
ncbi:MAG: pectinacetylesterase family protein [Myxococcales bacterium]|nr:pectinacetylesterase family protein [Myxococcales bacterium]MDH3484877.1 pectinacetylesterase family protein [Myxococcales bacterium]